MTNKEAIKAIRANWPPKNYSILREALTLAINALGRDEQPLKGCYYYAKTARTLVALMIVMSVCGTFKVNLYNTISYYFTNKTTLLREGGQINVNILTGKDRRGKIRL